MQNATDRPKRKTRCGETIPPIVKNFDALPDGAGVPVTVFSVVAGLGVSTIWRRAKREPTFPQPRQLGRKATRFNVGEIRQLLAG